MSELIVVRDTNMRKGLLATTSALALLTCIVGGTAKAGEQDRPTVWIDLSGQLSRQSESNRTFAPAFLAQIPSDFTSPQTAEHAPRYSVDGTAAVRFQPAHSDWHFAVSLRYGRSTSDKKLHEQTYPAGTYPIYSKALYTITRLIHPYAARFADAKVKQGETHAVVDFQVGRDVGLGLFGKGTSSFDAGIRFAQFTSKSNVALAADPDWRMDIQTYFISTFGFHFTIQKAFQPFHSYAARLEAERSFQGIGPSIGWKSSTPLAGSADTQQLIFDWGINGAILFGRQKARTHHQTTAHYHAPGTKYNANPPTNLEQVYQYVPPGKTRSRSVIVPNLGGFAGLSLEYPNARISFGYRADFFFGAMDGGIDVRKTYDRNFYGPFATIGIGFP